MTEEGHSRMVSALRSEIRKLYMFALMDGNSERCKGIYDTAIRLDPALGKMLEELHDESRH